MTRRGPPHHHRQQMRKLRITYACHSMLYHCRLIGSQKKNSLHAEHTRPSLTVKGWERAYTSIGVEMIDFSLIREVTCDDQTWEEED